MDMRAAAAPSMELQMARHMMAMVGDPVVLTDHLGLIRDVNPAFERLTGYGRLEVLGRPSNLLASGRHGPEFYRGMWRALQREGCWEGEVCDKLRDGTHRWFQLRIATLWRASGEPSHFLGVLGAASGPASTTAAIRATAAAGRRNGSAAARCAGARCRCCRHHAPGRS